MRTQTSLSTDATLAADAVEPSVTSMVALKALAAALGRIAAREAWAADIAAAAISADGLVASDRASS